MAFTNLPETARQAALDQGIETIAAVILDYAENTQGPQANARLNQALNGIRAAAETTITAGWPAVADEAGLATLWSHVLSHATYVIGAQGFDLDAITDPAELARAREIIDLSIVHTPSQQAAAGAITALRARQTPHPDDPCDPARQNQAGGQGQG